MARYAAIGSLILFSLFAGCSAPEKSGFHPGQVTHIVLCWLKEAGNETYKRVLIETSRSMAKIPGVLSVSAGEPVKSGRPIVDDSFDVGITFVFKDTSALRMYLENPLHKETQRSVLQPLVKKVVIYDILESGAGRLD
jgi:hypothetical protein